MEELSHHITACPCWEGGRIWRSTLFPYILNQAVRNIILSDKYISDYKRHHGDIESTGTTAKCRTACLTEVARSSPPSTPGMACSCGAKRTRCDAQAFGNDEVHQLPYCVPSKPLIAELLYDVCLLRPSSHDMNGRV